MRERRSLRERWPRRGRAGGSVAAGGSSQAGADARAGGSSPAGADIAAGVSSLAGADARAGVILLAAGIGLLAAARLAPGFGQWYAVTAYPILSGVLSRISDLFPFSLAEWGLYGLLVAALLAAVRLVLRRGRRWRKTAGGVFFTAALLFFLYAACCGVNYYRQPFSDYLEYGDFRYGKEELEELLAWLTEQVNASYVETEGRTLEELGAAGVTAMERLGEEYPPLAGYYPRPKPLFLSRILSVQQLCGVYSPFTVEANYNREVTPYNIPHTICHELSHLRGFMREDEANFIGFLACVGSEDPAFRYSGYLLGWIYAGNALAQEDLAVYSGYRNSLRAEADADLRANTDFWNRFESRVSEAAEALNDTYLRANSQTDGVKSYGRAVDLMLAWYQTSIVSNDEF